MDGLTLVTAEAAAQRLLGGSLRSAGVVIARVWW